MVVGSHSGDPILIMAGVPQGAILSTTLYNIFVSDIAVPRRGDSLDIIFADDVSQIVAGDQRYIKQLAKTETRRVNIFEKQWKIRTNAVKFKIVVLNRRKMKTMFYIGSSNIQASSTGRFLFFNLNQQGCFHVSRMIAAVGREALAKVCCLSGLSTARK